MMKSETHTSVLIPPVSPSSRGSGGRGATSPSAATPMIADLTTALRGDAAKFVAVAPIRLDVLGGLSEYAGGLVLGVPIAEQVGAAVQERKDAKIRVDVLSGGNGHPGFEMPAARLDSIKHRDDLFDVPTDLAKVVIALLAELRKSLPNSLPSSGFSLTVTSDVGDARRPSRDAALAAATMAVLASMKETPLEPLRAAELIRRVLNDWLDLPIGAADVLGALVAEPGKILGVQGDSHALAALPKEIVLLGIDCGDPQDDVIEKYRHVRATSWMGRLLCERILRHENPSAPEWDGRLARITMKDYVERFRDRIPTKMKGAEFLERFGETGDPLTRIDPESVYKIRSRTEHHIYEHTRAREFVELMSRCAKSCDPTLLTSAGAILDASHWSYGQRCGMGGLRSDLLVQLIRCHAVGTPIYGAKVCGLGCGGTVVVLMEPTAAAEAAIDRALEEFTHKTRKTPRKLLVGSPGVLVSGVARV